MRHLIVKDFKLLINDKKALFVNFALPMVLITLFVLAYSGMGLKYGLIQGVAGTAILMLLFGVRGLGGSILDEYENKTLSRILSSPITDRKSTRLNSSHANI